jgi:hypothetical protein
MCRRVMPQAAVKIQRCWRGFRFRYVIKWLVHMVSARGEAHPDPEVPPPLPSIIQIIIWYNIS